MDEVVELLKKKGKSISVMESCTGGGIANAITNIPGASDVFAFAAVTYANEYKIKFGVSEDVIREYSVYSINTAREMSKNITRYTNSSYGIGVTGKLMKMDPNNLYGEDNLVFISIYDREEDKYYDDKVIVMHNTREENKKMVIDKVAFWLKDILRK